MPKGFHESWRDFDPAKRQAPAPAQDQATAKRKLDRGSRQGAKRCIVDGTTLYEYDVAKAHGIKGIFFQSRKEAKRWISLVQQQEAGNVRNLRRQVRFSLQARRPDGLMQHVANYVADFVYDQRINNLEDRWEEIIEDTKPGVAGRENAFREDLYLLKRAWFEVQFGRRILES